MFWVVYCCLLRDRALFLSCPALACQPDLHHWCVTCLSGNCFAQFTSGWCYRFLITYQLYCIFGCVGSLLRHSGSLLWRVGFFGLWLTGCLVPLQLVGCFPTWKTCFLSMSPSTGRQILNHWAARKVPTSYIRIGVKIQKGELPGGPVVRTSHCHCQGPWDQSLVEELRSHKPQGAAKKIQKE